MCSGRVIRILHGVFQVEGREYTGLKTASGHDGTLSDASKQMGWERLGHRLLSSTQRALTVPYLTGSRARARLVGDRKLAVLGASASIERLWLGLCSAPCGTRLRKACTKATSSSAWGGRDRN